MTDIEAVILEYLMQQAGLTVHTGERIYASLYFPKDHESSKSILFNIRGGGPDYSGLVLSPSVQFRSYGPTPAAAREVDKALYDSLHDKSYCKMKMARLEVIGQLLQDPATRWPYVLSFYRISISSS